MAVRYVLIVPLQPYFFGSFTFFNKESQKINIIKKNVKNIQPVFHVQADRGKGSSRNDTLCNYRFGRFGSGHFGWSFPSSSGSREHCNFNIEFNLDQLQFEQF
jgi:hypothetical protein